MNLAAPIDTAAPGTLAWPITAALRALAMDAVERAKSGHPGAPMGMAEIAAALWRGHLRHDPADPAWPDRDRFVLSNGHGSMLLYALLHLSGYDLSIDDLKQFRQLQSKTPGHPEHGWTPGVETTTGPLGQGLANAVGMALAEKTLAAQFNRPGHEIVDHRTFVFLGDGCLMEGLSHEAASLAGSLKLGKLVCFWDDNGISIDGRCAEWFADDTPARFEAYGWQVLRGVDGHDPDAIDAATRAALAETGRPSLVCCRTVIGRGAPGKEGTEACHGAPLGPAEVAKVRAAMAWPHPPFVVPDAVRAAWDARPRGAALSAAWRGRLAAHRKAHPELAGEFARRVAGEPSPDFAAAVRAAFAAAEAAGTVATRKASQIALSAFAEHCPELFGGSADLAHSNLTTHPKGLPVSRDPAGNQVFFGVREFAMAAIANGLALHGGFIPYVATFLVFSDYARNAIRMSALMGLRVVYVLTHDSIALGEDGPTHQPVEHVESLRLIPGLDVWRPADAVETAAAWAAALSRTAGPTALVLSRQGLPPQDRAEGPDGSGRPVLRAPPEARATLVATGSEVGLAVAAAEALAAEGVPVRVVSLACVEVFERLDAAERDRILPPGLPIVAVEAGATRGWRGLVGREGAVVGIDRFGESGPEAALMKHFGFTVAAVVEAVKGVVARS